ncbi:hypothetical protein C8J47_1837 [Sphingomonas sp. PP-F2F-G114-C0414]|uniref:hypothetical protein n=1 Tax=Sphingomonas sp. PP-F2F-G114-C0414 TaxID=2135662 RepID=UPI000EF8BAA5|nr:hypothetical protein [Sphingomonas sp. PP-F2F-G114-C0414]RMB36300.1 hypothetical protein C8J47_1837 [Sphingomonas sp. PP-F2F-G114-C0414]
MTKTIYSIGCVHVETVKSLPPTLKIEADGFVNTSGWKNPTLSKHIYVTPPKDGVQGYDFVADEPGGIVAPVLTPVETAYTDQQDDWVTAVAIHSATNTVTVTVTLSVPVAAS